MKKYISLRFFKFSAMGCLMLAGTALKAAEEYRPELSQAQINALKRIAQLADVQWQPVLENTMPSRRAFFPARPVIGVPYSSGQFPGRRIGYDISLETFMTAVQNPKSVLYTENLREEPYNASNSATFYGLACSSFAQWAFRDDLSYGTSIVYRTPERANMTLVGSRNARDIEILDLLNTASRSGGHMEIVTDVVYSRGEIVSIEVTDIGTPGVRKRRYTPEDLNDHIERRNYNIYRYNIPDEIPYTPSKYVAVWDEEPQEIVYNRVLALDRGNRTNYERGLPVKFNIMDENAASLVVKRDGSVVDTTAITGTGVIEKNYPDCGKYSAHCIMKDGSKSDPVEFIIAEIKIDVAEEVPRGGNLTVRFQAEGCRPRILTGLGFRPLTEREIRDERLNLSVSERARDSYSIIIKGSNEFGSVFSNVGVVRTR